MRDDLRQKIERMTAEELRDLATLVNTELALRASDPDPEPTYEQRQALVPMAIAVQTWLDSNRSHLALPVEAAPSYDYAGIRLRGAGPGATSESVQQGVLREVQSLLDRSPISAEYVARLRGPVPALLIRRFGAYDARQIARDVGAAAV